MDFIIETPMPVFNRIPLEKHTEKFEWLTAITKTYYNEDRVWVRDDPRVYISYTVVGNENEMYRFLNTTQQYSADNWFVPMWSESDTIYNVTAGCSFLPFNIRYGCYCEYCFIWESNEKNEILTIDNVSTEGISLSSPTQNNYTKAYIMPAFIAFPVNGFHYREVEGNTEISAEFVILSRAYDFETLHVFNDQPDVPPEILPCFTFSDITQHVYKSVNFIDNGIGPIEIEPERYLPENYYMLNTLLEDKERSWQFKRFLCFLGGRYRTFLAPVPCSSEIIFKNVIDEEYGIIEIKKKNIYPLHTGPILTQIRFKLVFDNGTFYINDLVYIDLAEESQESDCEIIKIDDLTGGAMAGFSILPYANNYEIDWQIVNIVRFDSDSFTLEYEGDTVRLSSLLRSLSFPLSNESASHYINGWFMGA